MREPALEEFLSACGATGPVLLDVREGISGADRRALRQPFVLIGRKPLADVVLNHDDVGRLHSYLQMIDGRLFRVDLESRAGLRRDQGSSRSGWFDPASPIRIGPYQIETAGEGPPREGGQPGLTTSASPCSRAYADDHQLPGATLEIANEGLPPIAWPMTRAFVLVGQAAECHVRLKSTRVAEFHCSLLRTPTGLWLLDLLSEDGVTVNGVRRRFARLDEGDEVRLGRFSIRIHLVETPPAEGQGRVLARTDRARSSVDTSIPDSRSSVRAGRAATAILPATAASPSTSVSLGAATMQAFPAAFGPADSAIQPLLNQMGAFQQQMFDQFQQMLMMMAQVFSSMHTEHLDLVRDELEQVRRLNQELLSLRSELAHRPADPRSIPKLVGPSPRPGPNIDPAETASGLIGGRAALATRNGKGDSAHPRNGAKVATPTAPERTTARPGMIDPAAGPPTSDVHAMITRRLAAIEQERETRWEKILRTMKGL